jgi:SulP family sulfate permease
VKTPSEGDKTVAAMGVGNLLSGFMGGMGGNAMIGLSTINVLNGGKGRLAPTCTALVVMAATMGAYQALNVIPVAALSGIMIVVVLHTFKWFSLKIVIASVMPATMRKSMTGIGFFGDFNEKIPRTEALVIVGVTLVAIFANIAYAVLGGACFCAWMFAWNMGRDFKVEESYSDGTKIYDITGPLFFTSANKLVKILDPNADPDRVEVHLALSSVMDYSGMEAMNKIHLAYKKAGKSIQFQSVNAHSQRMITKAMKLWSDLDYQQEQKQKQVQPEPEQPDQKQVQPKPEQPNFQKTSL